jgi:hypothetical protein
MSGTGLTAMGDRSFTFNEDTVWCLSPMLLRFLNCRCLSSLGGISCNFRKKQGHRLLSLLLLLRRQAVLSPPTKGVIQHARNTGSEQLADFEAVLSPVQAPSSSWEYPDSTHACVHFA